MFYYLLFLFIILQKVGVHLKIFPAIDIKDGKAVRLVQGDYNQVTVFADKPEKVALDFKQQGAEFLHIVDLDGAKDGKLSNFDTIQKIISTGVKCQVGGGIRDIERIEKYLSSGVQRVILGSAALDDDFLQKAVLKFTDKIAVGVDAKNGFVATNGWLEVSKLDSLKFCEHVAKHGVKTIIYTDISRDGTMQGSNIEIYRTLQSKKSEIPSNIIASGGISSIEELKTLKKTGTYGAILGKALYLGKITVKKALEIINN